MTTKISAGLAASALVIGLSTQMTACTSTTPQLDSKYGESLRAIREAQTLNPGGTNTTDPVRGVDGKAAVQAQERYEESFKSPPATFEVIGGSTGGR